MLESPRQVRPDELLPTSSSEPVLYELHQVLAAGIALEQSAAAYLFSSRERGAAAGDVVGQEGGNIGAGAGNGADDGADQS